MRWVLGSMGPGHQAPEPRAHDATTISSRRSPSRPRASSTAAPMRSSSRRRRTSCRPRRPSTAASRRSSSRGIRLPIFVEVTVETTGTMLMGSEIGAALTALEPLGVDAIGLNCATGPTEMSEHLRHLSQHSTVPVACMPNAGLPVLTADGAHYPLSPAELATAHEQFVREFGLGLIGGCCGTTPEHLAAVVERLAPVPRVEPARRDQPGRPRSSRSEPASRASTSTCRSSRTRPTSRSASGPTPTARRRSARRCSPRTGTSASRSPATRSASARTSSTSASTTSGRDGVADMREVVSRFASASTLPLVIDSTEPAVHPGRARTHRRPPRHQLGELRGRRCADQPVRTHHAARQGARHGRHRAHDRRAGPGAHRRRQGAHRLAPDRHPRRRVGDEGRGHRRRLPHLPDRDRSGGDAPRRDRDDRRDPPASTRSTPASTPRSASRTSRSA